MSVMEQPLVASVAREIEIGGAPAMPVPPQAILMQAALGYIVSACLNVAVKLGVPDLLGTGSQSVEVLAQQSGANAGYLFRVLRVLEAHGMFIRKGREFSLTPAGLLLRTGVPGSAAAMAEWIADPLHLWVYSGLCATVETGATTFDAMHGEPFFQWVSRPENAEEAGIFNQAMVGLSEMCGPAFLEAYDFGCFEKIIDVGGGHGGLVRTILKAHPHLNGVVAEMASVVKGAGAAIAGDGLESRCEAVECNFFASVPEGGDCYLLKHILHDWADEPALQILRQIRKVIPETGTLVLAESVLDDSSAPNPGKLIDIEMMTFVGGKERTEEEFRELLAQAGFLLGRVLPTKSPLMLLEAFPA
jgi:hypothetical protein